MNDQSINAPSDSPFHAGEQAIQSRTGRREAMEDIGRKIIRPFMPDQHRQFFGQLPFVVLGSVDADGWPWASILASEPGFITSPDPKRLDLDAMPLADDPLHVTLQTGAPIGLLGIEIPTRRRNRMNSRVVSANANGFSLGVDQSFGNCPQYIQTRDIQFVRKPGTPVERAAPQSFRDLDEAAKAAISRADTFFVASYVQTAENPVIEGVDVSHRGGRAGFVKVDDNTLTIPDYSGNFLFNTLGNFLVNPKAGLIFPDFETGDVLMLTGTVELLWEDHPVVLAFQGAERGWRFTLDHGVRIHDALPFRANFGEYSPNSLMAGDWAQAEARLKAEALRKTWQSMRVTRIENESSVIRSFYLAAVDGTPPLKYQAGQFLTIRTTPEGAEKPMIRTYTASSAPSDPTYRISVKREPDGVVSNHLHDTLKVGDIIEAKAPKGAFHIDAAAERPAVLLAGGVGITPVISMASHVMAEGQRTRHTRSLAVFHATQDTKQRAFGAEFRSLEQQSEGAIRYYSFVNEPQPGETRGVDYNGTGFITAEAMQQVLPLADYDFFLCGPPAFMQALYDALLELGVRDARIFAESFGPASLKRSADNSDALSVVEEADTALVKFAKAGFDQQWSRGDATLLETAEALGLTPSFSCRNGVCGTCAVRKLSGDVTYRTSVTAERADDEVLICCAVPAKGTETLELDL
jgi:ferredoxin-NADP reductase/predicted pyridoxine 5'-phosphate oxidase superfamily flavin-nucleotide-binding protein